MKKRYIQPTTNLHVVEVHHILCVSDPTELTGTTMDNDATDSSNSDSNLGKEDFGW